MNFVPNPYIKKYWIIENPNLQKSTVLSPMISDGHIEIMLIEGSGARFWNAQDDQGLSAGIYVTGHMKSQIRLALLPRTKLHFIKLEHWASSLLSNCAFSTIQNSIVPLADLNRSLANKLKPHQPTSEINDIFKVLFEAMDNQSKGNIDFQMIRFVCNDLMQGDIDFKTQKRQILSETKISDRTLEKKFNQLVGLTPKQFSITVKMRRIVETLLYQNPGSTYTDLAFDNGFFDQPHFSRSFKAWFGQAPSKVELSDFFIPNSEEDFRYYTI